MSIWTQIVSSIDVETYITDTKIKEKIEKLLENAPKITGSEGNADIFVNILSGHNFWTNCDCSHCEYYHERECTKEDNNYECKEAEYQTRALISIVGSLRDKEKEKTQQEYRDFIRFLKKDCGFFIRNKTVKINE